MPILRAEGLIKRYTGVTVLHDVSLSIEVGEIHGVVGENGAGKSTLVKILAGIVEPDGGRIELDGRPVKFSSPREASAHGVVLVHQELSTLPNMSVADNVGLVRPPQAPRRRTRAERAYVRHWLRQVGLDIDPRESMAQLSVAQATLVEIARAVALNARVIIFDEPTAALPPREADHLLGMMEDLASQDRAVVFISHRLGEIRQIAKCVTCLRDGEVVAEFSDRVPTESQMIQVMVDRPVSLYANVINEPTSDVVLSVDDLSTDDVHNVTFEIHRGEIVGLAGLIGAGRSELARALGGLARVRSGSIRINGEPVRLTTSRSALDHGIALVPEDRKTEALIPGQSILENVHLGRMQRFRRHVFLDRRRMRTTAQAQIDEVDVRARDLDQDVMELSGGNQQKVVLARALESNPEILVLGEPTRGVDVGAKDQIHRLIVDLAASGTAILLISSELDEVMALSHRLVVMADQTVTAVMDRPFVADLVMAAATPRHALNGVSHDITVPGT